MPVFRFFSNSGAESGRKKTVEYSMEKYTMNIPFDVIIKCIVLSAVLSCGAIIFVMWKLISFLDKYPKVGIYMIREFKHSKKRKNDRLR